VGAKCNITKSVLGDVYKVRWGLKLPSNLISILENYVKFLNCPTVTPAICNQEDCTNIIEVFNCEFNVIGMTFFIEDGQPFFKINVGNYIGGTEPFTYQWFFDTDNFEAVGEINTDTLVLTVKPNKELTTLVTPITVIITDVNGCEDTKICYMTPDGLKCNTNYQPCSNPSGLIISNTFIACPVPSGLIISKV